MTTIIAVNNGEKTWMCSDRQITVTINGIDTKQIHNTKIFDFDEYLIGFSGAAYACDVFQQEFNIDSSWLFYSEEDPFSRIELSKEYLRLIEFQKTIYPDQEDDDLAAMIISTNNNIFTVDNEKCVLQNSYKYGSLTFSSIGSGSILAISSFYSQLLLKNKDNPSDKDIIKMLKNTLKAASLNIQTGTEIDILEL